jgi:hypothetical protein
MNFINSRDSALLPLIGRDGWRNAIIKRSVDSTLTVFIFDIALLESVSPESLVAKQLCSKKVVYGLRDLERLNWRIEYE